MIHYRPKPQNGPPSIPLGLSMCCMASLNTPRSDEGTSYYQCSKYEQPTDPIDFVSKDLEFMDKRHVVLRDNVNNPSHYTLGGIETTDYIKSRQSPERYKGHLQACILEYVSRSTHKGNELEDLKKAQWYLNRLVKEVENA